MAQLYSVFQATYQTEFENLSQWAQTKIKTIDSVKAHSKRYALVPLLKDEPVGIEKLLMPAYPQWMMPQGVAFMLHSDF